MSSKANFQAVVDDRARLVNRVADLDTENAELREALESSFRTTLIQIEQLGKTHICDDCNLTEADKIANDAYNKAISNAAQILRRNFEKDI